MPRLNPNPDAQKKSNRITKRMLGPPKPAPVPRDPIPSSVPGGCQASPDSKLIPTKIESKSTQIPINSFMKAGIIPPHPSSMCLIGQSGSGKSNTLVWMINTLYSNYFDEIIILSATGETDTMFKQIKTKKLRIITRDLLEEAEKLVDFRQKICEAKGVQRVSRMLVIFEDVSSQKKLMNSVPFLQAYVQLRHLGCSVISCAHKLRILPRMCRINSNALIMFPSNLSEKKILIEEYCPNGLTSAQFSRLIDHAWTPDEKIERPFLFINFKADNNERFRKGFHQILKLK